MQTINSQANWAIDLLSDMVLNSKLR